jgi:DNA-binding transcriptional LysR family regulator
MSGYSSLIAKIQVKGRLDSDNAWSALAAVRQGLGLARLPIFVVAEHLKSGELVSVLDDFMPEGQRFVVAYRPVKRIPGKLRVFIDFARSEFQADSVLWREF